MKKFKIFLILIVMGLIGFGGYYFYTGGYTEMEVVYSDTQREFFIGEKFNCDNLKATASKMFGGDEDVSDIVKVDSSNFDNTKIGKYKIKLTLKSISCEYEVSVVEEKVESFYVEKSYGSQKIQYLKGEDFFLYGVEPKIKVKTEVGGESIIKDAKPTIDSSKYKKNVCGDYEIPLIIENDYVKFSVSINVEVVDEITNPCMIYERTKGKVECLNSEKLTYKMTENYFSEEYDTVVYKEKLLFSKNGDNITVYSEMEISSTENTSLTSLIQLWYKGSYTNGVATLFTSDDGVSKSKYGSFLDYCNLLSNSYYHLNPMYVFLASTIDLDLSSGQLISKESDIMYETPLYDLSIEKTDNVYLFTCSGGEDEYAITISVEFDNNSILKVNDNEITFDVSDVIPSIPN